MFILLLNQRDSPSHRALFLSKAIFPSFSCSISLSPLWEVCCPYPGQFSEDTSHFSQVTWPNCATCANILQHFGCRPRVCSITLCIASFWRGGFYTCLHECKTTHLGLFNEFAIHKVLLLHSLPALVLAGTHQPFTINMYLVLLVH